MQKIQVLINMDINRARVRLALFTEKGKVIKKFGLNNQGEWILVPEGEKFPESCLLPFNIQASEYYW